MGNCQGGSTSGSSGNATVKTNSQQVKAVSFNSSEGAKRQQREAAPSKSNKLEPVTLPPYEEPKRSLRRVGNFPSTGSVYFQRPKEETSIKEALKILFGSTKEKHLAIVGEAGTGKSTLVAKVLGQQSSDSDDFLWRDCPVLEQVIWINAAGLVTQSGGSTKVSATKVRSKMAIIFGGSSSNADDSDDESPDQEASMWRSFALKKTGAILLVVDCGHQTKIPFGNLTNLHRAIKLVTIHRSDAVFDKTNPGLKVCEIGKIADDDFSQSFSKIPNFPNEKLEILKKHCKGLPSMVRLAYSALSSCQNRDLLGKMLERLEKDSIWNYSELSKLVLEPKSLVDKFQALTMFEPETDIVAKDLALVWSLPGSNEAETFCLTDFTEKGLVKSVKFDDHWKRDPSDKQQPDQDEDTKKAENMLRKWAKTKQAKKTKKLPSGLFQVDASLHDAFHRVHNGNFGIFLKEAGRKSGLAKTGENILHLAIRLRRGHLLSRIVAVASSEQLLELLNENGGDPQKTPLEILCSPENRFESGSKLPVDDPRRKTLEPLAKMLDKLLEHKFDENFVFDHIAKANDVQQLFYLGSNLGLQNLVKKTVAFGANLDLMNKSLLTPINGLMMAASGGHEAICRFLLEKGANPKLANDSQTTPLHLAARRGHEAIVKMLLEKGADPNAMTPADKLWRRFEADGETPLVGASENGHAGTVKLLTPQNGPKFDSNLMKACFVLAAQNGCSEVLTFFLGSTANGLDSVLNSATCDDKKTALFLAAENGHLEVVTQLFAVKGVDIEARDKDNRTALMAATSNGCVEVVKVLLEKSSRLSEQQKNAFLLEAQLFELMEHGDVGAVGDFLKNHPSATNSFENGLQTPLYAAIATDRGKIAEKLLESGANVESACLVDDGDKETALIKAVQKKDARLVHAILKRGAKTNFASQKVGTALVYAVSDASPLVARLLLDAGADPNVYHARNGDSALLLAVRSGSEELVEALLQSGADVNDRSGTSPAMTVAQKRGLGNIIELLMGYSDDYKMKNSGLI